MATRRRTVTGFTLVRFMRQMPISLIVAIQRGHGHRVKEKVLDTVIARGYVVPGGYSLEHAKIVNGEGYYNLYATNNQSKLLEGTTEKNVHMYLVTINAKTGWFKGNASRNAGNKRRNNRTKAEIFCSIDSLRS